MKRLVAPVVALALLGAGASAFSACSTVESSPAPDAAVRPCNPGPFPFCAPATPDVPGCSTDDGSYSYLQKLPRATRYPLGCTVNYVGSRDEQGDCPLEVVCKCVTAGSIAPPDGTDAAVRGPNDPVWYCSE